MKPGADEYLVGWPFFRSVAGLVWLATAAVVDCADRREAGMARVRNHIAGWPSSSEYRQTGLPFSKGSQTVRYLFSAYFIWLK